MTTQTPTTEPQTLASAAAQAKLILGRLSAKELARLPSDKSNEIVAAYGALSRALKGVQA